MWWLLVMMIWWLLVMTYDWAMSWWLGLEAAPGSWCHCTKGKYEQLCELFVLAKNAVLWMLSAFLDRLRRVNGHLQPCIFSIYLEGRLFDSLGKLKRPHENIRIVTIIFSLCSGPTRSQSQAQAPAKAVWAQPQMKPTLPPPPSTHPLPSRKQQISQNKRWRYESYRLWMLWKTRLLKRSI